MHLTDNLRVSIWISFGLTLKDDIRADARQR